MTRFGISTMEEQIDSISESIGRSGEPILAFLVIFTGWGEVIQFDNWWFKDARKPIIAQENLNISKNVEVFRSYFLMVKAIL